MNLQDPQAACASVRILRITNRTGLCIMAKLRACSVLNSVRTGSRLTARVVWIACLLAGMWTALAARLRAPLSWLGTLTTCLLVLMLHSSDKACDCHSPHSEPDTKRQDIQKQQNPGLLLLFVNCTGIGSWHPEPAVHNTLVVVCSLLENMREMSLRQEKSLRGENARRGAAQQKLA